jgi:signal transduction histidine kinase
MADKVTLNFRVGAGLKDIIGRDLITDDNIAVFELVKNSYDAHATEVLISFNNINSKRAEIVIEDNGKGMNFSDLKNKWLFVAYSAKKDGTEDNDYRSKIFQDRPFAGAKGIGRFSCDRLGTHLTLETLKDLKSSKVEILNIDWRKFEKSLTNEFVNIEIDHSSRQKRVSDKHGTILKITSLRSDWNREKLLQLKNSLAKLINPNDGMGERKFDVILNCEEEIETDALKEEEFDKVNGKVQNFIFEDLEIKTTKIQIEIDKNGEYITTTLTDGGTLIYEIVEKNSFDYLKDIRAKVFYLNRSAKNTFKRRMGVGTIDYGSIFVYKNSIRIYPYGEPNEDSFNLNKRKAQKPSLYLGNKDLIGRIEVFGKNEEFKETSSRGDGFIKNETYSEFSNFLENIVVKRLERYVIDVQKWGEGDGYLSIEDENTKETTAVLKARITTLISRISNGSEIIKIKYDEDILNIFSEKQSESATTLVSNLFKIAKNSNDQELLKVAEKTKIRVDQMRVALMEAERQATITSQELVEQTSENLFLKSLKSQEFDEVVSFMHSIGISATTIDNYLSGIYRKINRGQAISENELKKAIEIVSFENRKILSITRFSTKANFKIYTEEAKLDIVEFIKEYATNILIPLRGENINIKFSDFYKKKFVRLIRPIELSILVDNLLSNSIRSKSENFKIVFDKSKMGGLEISFEDDGGGIPEENLNKIFDFGFTTTTGSGLGLYHVSQIIRNLNATIRVSSTKNKSTTFTINIK